jgi:homoserine acetyltransferase
VNSVRESKDKENKSNNILRMEWFSMNSIRIAVSKTWWNKIIGNNHKVKGRKDCFVSV